MKRPLAAFALAVLALTALAGGASATHTDQEGAKRDFVRGSAKWELIEEVDWSGDGKLDEEDEDHLQVTATGEPTALNPWAARGRWAWRSPFESKNAEGDVTCLRTTGDNSAIVGGRFTRGGVSDGGSLGHDGEGIMVEVIDNGPGEDDRVRSWTAYVKKENLQSCVPPWEDNAGNLWQRGNFVVHKATP